MLAGIRSRLTYANVMATIAVFIALGAGAYAAGLRPNSVKSKHIVNNQVKPVDLRDDTLPGGGLTSADIAPEAVGGDDLKPPEVVSLAGLIAGPYNCGSEINQWTNLSLNVNNEVGYYRDPFGRVHLQGIAVKCGEPPSGEVIFTLPAGYRPDKLNHFGTVASDAFGVVGVDPLGQVQRLAGNPAGWISLDGLSFRCAPSGSNGCP